MEPVPAALGESKLFAQYTGDKPTRQRWMPIGETPRYCLDAIIAIEDSEFFEHRGFSLKSFTRAMLANLTQMRFAQGGSTITQQLIRNYFLTLDKTVSRKIKEIIMSLIFEFRVSKDDILETYLKVIYLGQDGVFEVRGYGSAAYHYFQKDLSELDLAECALLAAIVNNPGRLNPVKYPENAKKRRERVLTKMVENDRLSEEEKSIALEAPLPTRINKTNSSSAPYYIDAVNEELKALGFEDRAGLSVYTAMSISAQESAQKAVKNRIKLYETQYPAIVKIKKEKNIPLQALLVASDPVSGEVQAVVGGRDFRTSPYNRAIKSRRQVGSIFKPMVYLTALNQDTDPAYTPLTLLNNSPYELEYDNQSWSPKNYSGQFSGPLPLFYTLKESINVPTARLAMDVGLDNVIDTARSIGVTSSLKEYPSLSLGAFELAPFEVLTAYNTISQMGVKTPLHIVKHVTNIREELVYSHDTNPELVGEPTNFASLVGIMRETLNSGTATYARKLGFNYVAAGKTGTTSDTKDAWFAGFTPFHSAVVWVGYDDGTPNNLTGASGALPIWTEYMKQASKAYTNQDFEWPEGVEERELSFDELEQLGVPEEKRRATRLIFKTTSSD